MTKKDFSSVKMNYTRDGGKEFGLIGGNKINLVNGWCTMADLKPKEIATYGFAPALAADMVEKGIDLRLTRKILDKFNQGAYDHIEPVRVSGIPEVDCRTIFDISGDITVELDLTTAQRNIDRLGPAIDLTQIGRCAGTRITFQKAELIRLGIMLYPVVSYGVLNGGSASSYFDLKKNRGFNEKLFEICRAEFSALAAVAKDKAKGLAPAYINRDGSIGPTFIELKMRAILIQILNYRINVGNARCLEPMFQMTSVYNNDLIHETYLELKDSPYLHDLIAETGVDITAFQTGIQPMLAALTHSREGRPKSVFAEAYGRVGSTLPMPGGHGQNFEILRDVYQELYRTGIRFVYLGNVDNLGYTVDPTALALIALHHKQAGFDFSFRTAVDIKGGILIYDQYKRLNCADIGPAISPAEVFEAEKSGKSILFNCATGLFDLEYLVGSLDSIIENLPVRITDQDKDPGLYSQTEQVTWEIIGMLDNFMIFGVDKYDRFLAAKLVLEGLMASGVGLSHPEYPTDPAHPKNDLKGIALKLNQGLERKLATVYGMKKTGDRWEPRSVAELREELRRETIV
jgi:UTP--glucose-1-phosphate uridylyltransferase